MKLAAICLFSAVYAAAYALAADLQPAAAATSPSLSEENAPQPTGMTAEDYEVLEARQAPHDPNAGGAEVPTQFPTVTTDWRPTVLKNGQTTYWADAYTQTFAKVPDQLPSPGSGSIGYGTLKEKSKRAEATPAGAVATVIAEPVVVIMQTTIIVQPIQRITEIQIVETVRETATPPQNATRPSASFHPSGTGVFLGTGTAPMGTGSFGTAVSSMPSAPYNDTEPEPWTKRFF